MRRSVHRLGRDDGGSAAAEMALVTPFLIILLFGVIELGNYFLSEHVLVKGLRDAAVFASRRDLTNFNCATNTVDASVVNGAKALARTGQLSGGTDRLPNWADADTTFTVNLSCSTTAPDGTVLGGIYTANNGVVPVVTINASVPYRSVARQIGFDASDLNLVASQQATVVAI